MEVKELLKMVAERGASDLHLKAGTPPCLRIDGKLIFTDLPRLTAEDALALATSVMTKEQKEAFERRHEIDFAYTLSEVGRFRANIYQERGNAALAFRLVVAEPAGFEELGLPPVVKKLAEEPRGLILVTGTAGSGKTTTLAAMVNHINDTRRAHIITIEDPIEVLHQDKKSIVNQREIGADTDSYVDALKYIVRQDPDVILIGEMRDVETVRTALSAAEMGNLVLSTLHTIDVAETVNRIIDFFPVHQQRIIRIMLAHTLRGVVSQRLLPKTGGGLVPAVEVMVNTATTSDHILKPEETYKIKDAMEEGEYYGMQSFDQHLIRLYEEKKVSLRDALSMAANAHDFKLKLKQLGLDSELRE